MKPLLSLIPAVALAACAPMGGQERAYGNDALPSAQVIAFQAADARLGWRDARIEYDASSCAVYQGTAPNGQERREPLRDQAGQPICAR